MGLTGMQHVHQLLTRALGSQAPDAPRRRSGTDAAFGSALSHVQAELAEIHRYAKEVSGDAGCDDDAGDPEVRRARIDLCLELASILFAAGAPHPQWRWWASQAAGALLEAGDVQAAAIWAVIAHDDRLVRRLPEAPESGVRPGRIVWRLASRIRPCQDDRVGEEGAPSEGLADSVDAAWAALARSIPAADHETTGTALRTITDFWLDEDEDWQQFHPGAHPDFEPELNAIASLAHRSGWEPSRLPPDALRFLEPGLAPGTPS